MAEIKNQETFLYPRLNMQPRFLLWMSCKSRKRFKLELYTSFIEKCCWLIFISDFFLRWQLWRIEKCLVLYQIQLVLQQGACKMLETMHNTRIHWNRAEPSNILTARSWKQRAVINLAFLLFVCCNQPFCKVGLLAV